MSGFVCFSSPNHADREWSSRTANELKWVIRIILKDLKISFRERTVLHALHPDAIDLFNVCSDLKRVCWTLYDPSYRLPHEVFRPSKQSIIRLNLEWLCTGRSGEAVHAI